MSGEKRKPNIVDAPTIFIGVGGTGSQIVKKVYDLCIPEERENISFVCMDTNVNDLNHLRGSAKDIVAIQTSTTQTVGSYLDSDADASKNWFPKNAVIYDKTVSEGAGQLRAISRLALNATIKTGKIAPLYTAIDNLFKKNGQEMKQALRICICSTASGGTGSGMILPFCMFLRDYVNNKYPNAAVIVRTLILLPETLDSVIKSSIERDSQRRNAYATIKEFNAFMMKGSGFCDIEQVLRRYSDFHIDITDPGRKELKKLSVLPCDFCFLLDGQDAEDATSNSFEQYKNQAALALYEQNIGPMQKKAFSVEDNIIKELSNPGNYGRNRFGGIGAGRIVYPYEKVADYIAYDWAKDNIGGDKEASKWGVYDQAARDRAADDEKNGRPIDEITKMEVGYVDAMNSLAEGDNFSKSLISHYGLKEADDRIEKYFESYVSKIDEGVLENKSLKQLKDKVFNITGKHYDKPENWTNATSDYTNIHNYYNSVSKTVAEASRNIADGILRNKDKTINQKDKQERLESLIWANNSVMHPCAARYMLYKLTSFIVEKRKNLSSEINQIERKLKTYEQPFGDSIVFKIGKEEVTIDSLKTACEFVASLEKEKRKSQKLYDSYGQKANMVSEYLLSVENYRKLIEQEKAVSCLESYLKEINKQFLKFFDKFPVNVKNVETKQQDILDELKYKKGDSIRYICSSKEVLDGLSGLTKGSMIKNQLLDDELNATIFDQIKINTQLTEEYNRREGMLIENDERADVFNTILLGYFCAKVRTSCPEIDLNIIDAIKKEKLLADAAKNKNEEEHPVLDEKSMKGYIKEVLASGEKLSAPGIQRMISEEPREINVCAYNTSLKDMRGSFRITELLPNGEAVDTVSQYELHYFNALYNLTPDRMKKFAAPKVTETGVKPSGLYHNAYTTYTRDIGPDCQKSSKMTTHIDRRWDSIAAMPELDLSFQHLQFIRTHKALIYGLVLKRISREAYQDGSVKIKNPAIVYRYHNNEGFVEDMVVTNGTLCDEFYEILDSLYIDRRLVADIYDYENHETAKDIMKRVEYRKTKFNESVEKFVLHYNDEVIEGASLFLIPLMYSVSLPSRMADDAEIACLIDAVIEVFSEQIKKYESTKNAKFILCEELDKQFERFKENYKIGEINKGIDIEDNKVVDVIKRKIREVLESSPQPQNYEEIIDKLASRVD